MGPGRDGRSRARRVRRLAGAAALALVGAAGSTQPLSRTATTAEGLVAAPVFYHGRQVVLRHAFSETRDVSRLEATAKPVLIFWRERPPASEGEIRGEFWDLGRLREDDSRFAAFDFARALEAVNQGRWPARDQVFAIINASLIQSLPSPTPTIRAIALDPAAYEGRGVSLVGRFRGANLYGDLAQPLGKARWDFVLQSADAAIWVTGVRPRGKGFDLNPTARVDTGRWLQVTGVVRHEAPIAWIQGESVQLAAEPDESPIEISIPVTPREPPPEVVFSSPIPDEPAVDTEAPVRIQFSRDMDGRSFAGRVRAQYIPQPGAPAEPPLQFRLTYREGARALEIRFDRPLDRFRTVRVDLLDGIAARDGTPMQPWSLTFTTGG